MSEDDYDYVLPLNTVIAERILRYAVAHHQPLLLDAFKSVAHGVAPHVNRLAIMRRSPEARLAGRLFDADKIARPLLGANAEQLYGERPVNRILHAPLG